MSDQKTNIISTKRKPGRPRKKPVKESSAKNGILSTPMNSENLIELTYDKPFNFKRICSYWKSLNAEKITWLFTPLHLYIYTKDYNSNNYVQLVFDGSKMNGYHCSQEKEININFNNLELVLQKLDKTYETVSFVVTKKDANKLFYVILKNEENIPEYFDMDIIMDFSKDTYQDIFYKIGTNYALEFRLKGKYFKKAISDTKHFEKQWTIEKLGNDGNLIFSYRSNNGQVRAKIVPDSFKDIQLVCNVKPGEIFSVSVFTNNIKPTSSNQLADYINIKAAKDKPLLINAELDENAIFANILVKIVDYKSLDTSNTH